MKRGETSGRRTRSATRDGRQGAHRDARQSSERQHERRTAAQPQRDERRTAGQSQREPHRQAEPLATVPDAAGTDAGGRLYGLSPVLEALKAGQRPIEQITIAEGAHHFRLRELLELAHRSNVPVRRAPRIELERAVGSHVNHQGVVAAVAAARYTDAEELLDRLAARTGTIEPPLAVVLDGVEDPRNLGAILRTVDCVGAHGVFIPERRAAGLTEIVAKTAAGALEHVPVARASNVSRLIEQLKERNIWTVGTSADAPLDYTAWDFTQPSALVLGGEGAGLHRLVRERCDVLVRIPVRGHIESLNVSVAAGIVLYEALRQRTLARPWT